MTGGRRGPGDTVPAPGARRLGTAGAVLFGLVASLAGMPAPGAAVASARREAAVQVRQKDGCAKPTGVYNEQSTPWAQRLLDPARVWPLTKGENVLVAVLGTGVDASNAQFGPGQIRAGADLVRSGPTTTDCDGRGTIAAGIIAARPVGSTTFVGMAPSAAILSVRYTQATQQAGGGVDPNAIAAAIRSAAGRNAGVICVLVPAAVDSPALREAVRAALAAGIVIVSPVASAQASDVATRSYPTSEPGVLAVGGVSENGEAVTTNPADDVAVVAPGSGLVSTSAGTAGAVGHFWPVDDSTFAAAYVAGVVALVRAYRPALSPEQVVTRIERTAARPPSAGRDRLLGWGVVNPYAAVTAEGMEQAAEPTASAAEVRPARAVAEPGVNRAALVAGLAGLALTGLIAVAAHVVRHGRRQGWRPRLRRIDG